MGFFCFYSLLQIPGAANHSTYFPDQSYYFIPGPGIPSAEFSPEDHSFEKSQWSAYYAIPERRNRFCALVENVVCFRKPNPVLVDFFAVYSLYIWLQCVFMNTPWIRYYSNTPPLPNIPREWVYSVLFDKPWLIQWSKCKGNMCTALLPYCMTLPCTSDVS